ncbi:hypothetical protein M407DRAFT_121493 [Tulasnella calospora MUT 4182]|uniref:Uncharacterized protein n=1 Tax=Tulasnella calospora MUT 4182 TaxID=1051891 RepID=A0A0C3MDP3_9AGAM|nr:hypothetical protein M407DRAFT_121493 [Tulasnella calospora MUT 4182]
MVRLPDTSGRLKLQSRDEDCTAPSWRSKQSPSTTYRQFHITFFTDFSKLLGTFQVFDGDSKASESQQLLDGLTSQKATCLGWISIPPKGDNA